MNAPQAENRAQMQRLGKDGKPRGEPLKVSFNPTEYTLTKGVQIAEVPVPGLDAPLLQFVRGQVETLSLDLFFDSTDGGTGKKARSVTEKTDQFYALVKIEKETHAPPICLFSWGGACFPGKHNERGGDELLRFAFKCVVESVRQRFTLFNPDGVPLRATLTVSLKEYKTLAEQIQEIDPHSADRDRAHVVRQHETLSAIAAELYDDPTQWRWIAEANDVEDPLELMPGAVLTVPRIQ
jgi:hypothetical protein